MLSVGPTTYSIDAIYVIKAKMKKLRVSNAHYLSASPYRLLAEEDWINYEEGSAQDNARKLHAGEVDLALIPVAEFGAHAGYVGLDYGLACEQRSDCLMLYSQQPVQELKTVFLYEGSSTSALLLRVLLREVWNTNLRLVRRHEKGELIGIEPFEGMLLRHETSAEIMHNYPFAIDLVEYWHKLTSLPFVFMCWALKPGNLGYKRHQLLHDLFERSTKASSFLAGQHAQDFEVGAEDGSNFVANSNRYYLNANMLAGLDDFFSRAYKLRFLPKIRYQNARANLIGPRKVKAVAKPLSTIIDQIMQGLRVSVGDCSKLAEEAELSDLALLSSTLAQKGLNNQKKLVMNFVQEDFVAGTWRSDFRNLRGINEIIYFVDPKKIRKIDFYEMVIRWLKSETGLPISGFYNHEIIAIAELSQISAHEAVLRLVAAGLDMVLGLDQEVLFKNVQVGRDGSVYASNQSQVFISWLHHWSIHTAAPMPLALLNGWQDRILQLHMLRMSQDENPGFAYFYLDARNVNDQIEDFLRVLAISRIYLDNIDSVAVIANADNIGLLDALVTSFGADSLRLYKYSGSFNPTIVRPITVVTNTVDRMH